MKHLDEFGGLLREIHAATTRPWALMAVCGGQTRSIIRHGLDRLLPDGVEMLHGPGCPVCVTPLSVIDKALAVAARPGVILCSSGDLLRVPGSGRDLFEARAAGADVRVVGSPLDALGVARANPRREVVFFGIGFETAAPGSALTVREARRLGVRNLSLLVSHVLASAAVSAIMESPRCRAQAFLAAGHLSGAGEYPALSAKYGVPIVVTGSGPLDVLEGVRRTIVLLEQGRHIDPRAVPATGDPVAPEMPADVFEVTGAEWRGIGVIPGSGWRLTERYRDLDAEHRFGVAGVRAAESALCRSGEVLQGLITPHGCAAFGRVCTPRQPLGATMVSSEGACAAYHAYRRVTR